MQSNRGERGRGRERRKPLKISPMTNWIESSTRALRFLLAILHVVRFNMYRIWIVSVIELLLLIARTLKRVKEKNEKEGKGAGTEAKRPPYRKRSWREKNYSTKPPLLSERLEKSRIKFDRPEKTIEEMQCTQKLCWKKRIGPIHLGSAHAETIAHCMLPTNWIRTNECRWHSKKVAKHNRRPSSNKNCNSFAMCTGDASVRRTQVALNGFCFKFPKLKWQCAWNNFFCSSSVDVFSLRYYWMRLQPTYGWRSFFCVFFHVSCRFICVGCPLLFFRSIFFQRLKA